MKLAFLAPLAALAIAGVAAGAYLWVTAEGPAEEQLPSAQEPTPTATLSSEPQPRLTPSPTATPQPTPPDWLSYSDPETGVTLRYPPDWVLVREQLSKAHDLYQVTIYKPVPNPPPRDTFPGEIPYPPSRASVSLQDCCLPGFLEFWACDRPPEKVTVGTLAADRCVYTRGHPPPDGFQFPEIGAAMLYTVHTAGGDLYLSVGLFTWDDTGTVILDSWSTEDEDTAEDIIQSLEAR